MVYKGLDTTQWISQGAKLSWNFIGLNSMREWTVLKTLQAWAVYSAPQPGKNIEAYLKSFFYTCCAIAVHSSQQVWLSSAYQKLTRGTLPVSMKTNNGGIIIIF